MSREARTMLHCEKNNATLNTLKSFQQPGVKNHFQFFELARV